MASPVRKVSLAGESVSQAARKRNVEKIVALIVAFLGVLLIRPLLSSIAMGAVVAIAAYPIYLHLQKQLSFKAIPLSEVLSALLVTVILTVALVIPLIFVVFFGVQNAIQELQNLQVESVRQFIINLTDSVSKWLPVSTDWLVNVGDKTLSEMINNLGLVLGLILRSTPKFLISAFVIVVSIYAFLLYSNELLIKLRKLSVFSPGRTEQIFQSTFYACRLVVLAAVISALAQSVLFGIVISFLKVSHVPLLMLGVFICSFIPILGASVITYGLAGLEILQGNTSIGTIVLITAIAVSFVDNIIRPLVVSGGRQVRINFFVAFIAVVGAFQTIGFFGFFLGPVFAQAAISLLEDLESS